jgi:hypothetical protein
MSTVYSRNGVSWDLMKGCGLGSLMTTKKNILTAMDVVRIPALFTTVGEALLYRHHRLPPAASAEDPFRIRPSTGPQETLQPPPALRMGSHAGQILQWTSAPTASVLHVLR